MSSRTATGEHVNGLFLPIIERNTIVPASRSHVLHTIADNQRKLNVKIYQGEARFTRDNVYLGELSCAVPMAPAGREQVDVRFSYDASGLLDVDVTVVSTRVRQSLLIEGNPGVLNADEIARRLAVLAKLKVHPRDDQQNVALITRCERLFEENLGNDRRYISEMLDGFLAILESQEPELIAAARERLKAQLDQIDHSILS